MDVSGLKALVNSHNMHVSLAFQFHLNTYSNRIFQLNKPPIDPISNPFPYFSNALVGKMSGLLSVLERLKVIDLAVHFMTEIIGLSPKMEKDETQSDFSQSDLDL